MSAPGWFPDPDGTPGRLRWWDGRTWTSAVQSQGAPEPQPGEVNTPAQSRREGSRTASSWVIMGLLALILGVTLGLLIKPFGSPAPLPSSTHPAATDPSSPAQTVRGECSLGMEDGRLRAGALSVEAPASQDWELLENHPQPEAVCANWMERPFMDVSGSHVIVFERPGTSADLDEVASNVTAWALNSLFVDPLVSSHDDTPTYLDDKELPTVRFEVSDLDRGRSEVHMYLAEDGLRGYSIVLTSCVVDAEDHCPEVEKVLASLRWER